MARPGEILSVINKRQDVMTRIFDGVRDRRTLKDELDQSRSTVYRALEELAEAGLVTESSRTYEPTMFGRLVFAEYEQCIEQIEAYDDAAGMVRSIEAVEEIPEWVLARSELIPALRPNPRAAVQTTIHDTIREASEVRVLSPVVRPRSLELLYERLHDGTLRADVVLEREVLSHLETKWRRRFEPYLESNELSVRLTDRTLPFGVVLGDQPTACFTIYDTSGRFEGIVRSESTDIVDWADETFEEWRDRSKHITTFEGASIRAEEGSNT